MDAESSTTWSGALLPTRKLRIGGITPMLKPVIYENTENKYIMKKQKTDREVFWRKWTMYHTAPMVEGAKTCPKLILLEIFLSWLLILSEIETLKIEKPRCYCNYINCHMTNENIETGLFDLVVKMHNG